MPASKIASAIQSEIEARRISKARAAAQMGISTVQLNQVLGAAWDDYSLPWLLEKLYKLGMRVELTIFHPDRALDRVSETTAPYDDATD